jgi:hypothetical protein
MTSIQTPKFKSILGSYSSGVFNQNPPFLDCIALKSKALRSFEKSNIQEDFTFSVFYVSGTLSSIAHGARYLIG